MKHERYMKLVEKSWLESWNRSHVVCVLRTGNLDKLCERHKINKTAQWGWEEWEGWMGSYIFFKEDEREGL